jgi:hypothetical protein
MIDYLCALFVGDKAKLQHRHIIRQHVGQEMNMGESKGKLKVQKYI